jgi:geranylgeranyl diphosphate synthase, type II
VLSGDALLNEAMNILFKFCSKGLKNSLKACTLISEAAGAEGMIGGQVVDILSEGKKISTEELMYMHSKKTGALIKCSILAGGLLGNASAAELEILDSFGEKLGLAFQIKDDILDVIGDTSVLGKKVKSDEDHNKTTFISIYGLDKCIELCSILTEESLSLLDKLKGDTTNLKNITLFLLKREF